MLTSSEIKSKYITTPIAGLALLGNLIACGGDSTPTPDNDPFKGTNHSIIQHEDGSTEVTFYDSFGPYKGCEATTAPGQNVRRERSLGSSVVFQDDKTSFTVISPRIGDGADGSTWLVFPDDNGNVYNYTLLCPSDYYTR